MCFSPSVCKGTGNFAGNCRAIVSCRHLWLVEKAEKRSIDRFKYMFVVLPIVATYEWTHLSRYFGGAPRSYFGRLSLCPASCTGGHRLRNRRSSSSSSSRLSTLSSAGVQKNKRGTNNSTIISKHDWFGNLVNGSPFKFLAREIIN